MAQYSPAVQTLLNRIDSLHAQIEALRPIKLELTAKIFQKYRLDWNYNSNSIEGNSLNYGETVAFIMEGLTAKGKPLKDHLDIKGHNDAIDFLIAMQQQDNQLTEMDIRSLHKMILVEPYQSKAQTADGQATTKTIQLGVYKSLPNHVVTRTGETHYYASPEETPALMQELMDWYRTNQKDMHPLILSTLFHHKFVAIHPFDDGNGRMSRLISNLLLMQAGLPPVVVRQDQKSEYYGVLSQADAGITDPLIEYFAELLTYSLEIYLKGANGEDISDPSDLDKEITLFISGFDEDVVSKIPLSRELAEDFNDLIFKNLMHQFHPYMNKINLLFFESNVKMSMHSYDANGINIKNSEFKPVLSSEFFDNWFDNSVFQITLNSFFRENYLKDGSIRIIFYFNFDGFKAKENVNVSAFTTIDLERSFYRIIPFNNDNSFVIDKHYPKSFTNEELKRVTSIFFKGLMNSITKTYTEVI